MSLFSAVLLGLFVALPAILLFAAKRLRYQRVLVIYLGAIPPLLLQFYPLVFAAALIGMIATLVALDTPKRT